MQLPRYLSQSAINTFRSCPYRYYCDKVGKPSVKADTTARDFGITIHHILENYYGKIPDFPTEAEIIKHLDQAMIESGNHHTDNKKTKTKRIRDRVIKLEKERVKAKQLKPSIVEKKYTISIFDDLPPVTGIIDVYFPDTGIIYDWKTGRHSEMTEGNMIQGKMYEMMLEKEGLPVNKFVFQYLDVGVSPILPKCNDGWLENIMRDMCSMIENDSFPQRPSGLCSWCPFILSCKYKDVCPWSI